MAGALRGSASTLPQLMRKRHAPLYQGQGNTHCWSWQQEFPWHPIGRGHAAELPVQEEPPVQFCGSGAMHCVPFATKWVTQLVPSQV